MKRRPVVDVADKPGGWDALHLIDTPPFASSNEWGIPDLLPALPLPEGAHWRGYRDRGLILNTDVLHCFLDDYRFEVAWSRPGLSKRHVQQFSHAVAPDFSQYPEWPVAANLWQAYRSAWVARLWQSWGVNVIPAPNWSSESPPPWQWAGLPVGGPVAVQVPDVRVKATKQRFTGGWEAMLQALRPSVVYLVGRLPEGCTRPAVLVEVPSFGAQLRARLAQSKP